MSRILYVLMFLVLAPTTVEGSTRHNCLATECHADLSEGKYVHYTIKTHYMLESDLQAGCLVCHVGSYGKHPEKDHFNLAYDGKEMLCRQCHEGMPVEYESTHGVIEKIGCLPCHEPHRSEHRLFLKNMGQGLCDNCHDQMSKTHKNINYLGTKGSSPDCLYCHRPHVSHLKALLKKEEKKGPSNKSL